MALKLEQQLSKLGFETVMVRETDIAVNTVEGSLREKKRSDILYRHSLMDQYEDSIYLCIHQNHFGQTSVHGAQVFYSENDEFSKVLAQDIQTNIKQNLQTDNNRQIKPVPDSVYIIKNATVTSVLIECGFLSNPNDLSNLKSEEYQLKLADIIADSVGDFALKHGG